MKNVAALAVFQYDLIMIRDSGLLFGPPYRPDKFSNNCPL